MNWWARRIAVVAGVIFVSFSLSGCDAACGTNPILEFLFCAPDGASNFAGDGSSTPGGPSRASAASGAVGLAFTAKLSAAPVAARPGTQTQSGEVHALRGALLSGSFGGKVPAVRGKRARKARALLAAVLRATWRGRVGGTVDAKTGARHADILALATLPRWRGQRRADRACLRIAITGATGRKPTGTFSLLGAAGAARRLSLSGTFAYGTGKLGSIAGTARVKTRAPHALSASCRALAA